ncbi:MAG: delta-aminolevulinic acid dehydratase [Micavibrio sp.]|nr:MAG: delta-aminolevulinic acid dehydratase [Micavibrio sp.]
MLMRQKSQPKNEQGAESTGSYPRTRMRRLRQKSWIREMVAEHSLSVSDLVWPVFITEGKNQREYIKSMPGVERRSTDLTIEALKKAHGNGVQAVALFPVVPDKYKTMDGREAFNPDNLMCRAVQEIKNALPDMGIITDVALDPYTTHGHDGLVEDDKILNDETVEILCRQAVVQARAGADIIAPSDMMDGRIGAIRDSLESESFTDTMILSYAAKYASSFYGPFREAVGSGAFLKGDKKTYQMNPANADEALLEVALDIKEGADMVMIKPGLPYLDVLHKVKETFKIPTFAYQVSGEYAMLKAAAEYGCLDYEHTLMETMIAFKRAGADGIFTYAAPEIAKTLQEKSAKG